MIISSEEERTTLTPPAGFAVPESAANTAVSLLTFAKGELASFALDASGPSGAPPKTELLPSGPEVSSVRIGRTEESSEKTPRVSEKTPRGVSPRGSPREWGATLPRSVAGWEKRCYIYIYVCVCMYAYIRI